MGGRLLRDRIFKIVMLVGGISVIIAVSSIFFYLASVVVPLFTAPTIEARARFAVPGPADQKTFGLSGEEQREIGARYSDGGTTTFFRFADGTAMSEATVAVPAGVQITSTAIGERRGGAVAYGLSDGRVILTKIGYQVTFPDNKRLITPEIEYPLGTDPLPIDERGQAIVQLAVESNEDGTTIAAKTADGRVIVSAVKVTTNLMTG
jgi:phosphate transport system permease protein